MKRLIGGKAFVRMLVLVTGVLFLFSCDLDEDDMREKVLWSLGEPDEVLQGGYGAYAYYYYYYDNIDINLTYVFMKSASGCGSSGNWYIAETYLTDERFPLRTPYHAPAITHTPVTSSSPGRNIEIVATISDDEYVKDAVLYYKIAGVPDSLADSTEVVMNTSSSSDTTYTAAIDSEKVTDSGILYFITATDGDGHTTRLPKLRGYYTIRVTAGAAKALGATETSTPVIPRFKFYSREENGIPL